MKNDGSSSWEILKPQKPAMVKKLHYIILFLLFCNHSSYSQGLVNSEEEIFKLNVKQFNEFVDRFNYVTDINGDPIDSVFSEKISREEYLHALFNLSDSRLKDKDSEYQELKRAFIEEVINKSIRLQKYSNKIIAEAKSTVTYKNSPHEISIYLNQEIENKGVKWVMLSVEGEFLDVLKEDTVMLRFIPPTSNETNFISLRRVFADHSSQQYYAYNGFQYDPMSTLFFLINTGEANFEYVNEIVYHILDIPGWEISVKEFVRNTENSGWLIDNISRKDISFEIYLEELGN